MRWGALERIMERNRRKEEAVEPYPDGDPSEAAVNSSASRAAGQPWYELAREAAQIVVSALALYASIRSFLEKMRRRRRGEA